MKARLWPCLLLCAALFSAPVLAETQGESVRLERSKAPKETIPGLSWNTESWIAVAEGEGKDAKLFVTLEGAWASHPDWMLLYRNQGIPLSNAKGGTQKFSVKVQLDGKKTPVRFYAVNPLGDIQEEHVTLAFPTYAAALARAKAPPKKPPEEPLPRFRYQASLGLSMISYTETLVPDFSEQALTAKISGLYQIVPDRWEAGLSGYGTVTALSTNQSGISARFLGLNARVGYVVPGLPSPWRLSVMGGAYFTTMSVSEDAFGFQNLMGPQLFPVLSRPLPNGDRVSGYLKYSPIGSGFGIESFGNREIAIGGSWTRRLKSGHPLTASVDFANLSLTVEDSEVSSTSFSLSVGYGW